MWLCARCRFSDTFGSWIIDWLILDFCFWGGRPWWRRSGWKLNILSTAYFAQHSHHKKHAICFWSGQTASTGRLGLQHLSAYQHYHIFYLLIPECISNYFVTSCNDFVSVLLRHASVSEDRAKNGVELMIQRWARGDAVGLGAESSHFGQMGSVSLPLIHGLKSTIIVLYKYKWI